MNFFYSYIFPIIIIINICVAQKNYQSYKIQDYEICAEKSIVKTPLKKLKEMFDPPEISLSYNKPVTIKQIWNSTIVKRINTNCKFRVKTTSKKLGIYVVITKIKFRKDKNTDACLDYLEFSQGKKPIRPRFCGSYDTNELNSTISFDIDSDEISIKVYIKDKDIDEPLELELYLTAHGSCNQEGYQCEFANLNSCIHKDLFRDNIPNCLQCNDEETCIINDNLKRKTAESIHIDYSHIVISALTSLIFTMFAVSTIAYTCWKYWHFCHPVQSEASTNEAPTLELPETQFTGTITMDYLNQNRPPSPKDLPPSYEDLFPDR